MVQRATVENYGLSFEGPIFFTQNTNADIYGIAFEGQALFDRQESVTDVYGLAFEFDLVTTSTPNPLTETVAEGASWTTNNTTTVNTSAGGTFDVTEVIAAPSWVTIDFDDTGSTQYPTGTVLGFTTPSGVPYDASGVHTWTYTIDDGVAAPITLTVTLTVTETPRVPTMTPDSPSPYSGTVGKVFPTLTIDVADPDGGNVTIDVDSGALPTGLSASVVFPYGAAVPYSITIDGIPTTAGAYSVTLSADDGTAPVQYLVLDFEIKAAAANPMYVSNIPHVRNTVGKKVRA